MARTSLASALRRPAGLRPWFRPAAAAFCETAEAAPKLRAIRVSLDLRLSAIDALRVVGGLRLFDLTLSATSRICSS